ncbi:CHASE2 domain-containing protein [cf. Phormidesmis sp. LEGE 11477]|uniref:sensor histidine kinase n=1 Tax=cf. Phormidesmis sp. LEGE 11477 TaxID=1828680 RepID=UPI001880D2D6|nr:CHASE2 domain-containing protein [cf. Phormidesmis sp. LEGE 11477]MBE9064402.1 CHASE2 domain-containing protein [cf. Phormidesmis sp. LEGE 11477]
MLRETRARIIHQLTYRQSVTKDLIVPGALIIGLVCLIRLSGLLQTQEWMSLDTFSRYCPRSTAALRVTLVTIDEEDYQTTGVPISAEILARTLQQLQTYQPRAIGLDISRDLPRGEEYSVLSDVLTAMPNVIVAEIALSEAANMNVAPPDDVPPEQIGFADVAIDPDGKLRRVVLATRDDAGVQKYSLASRLARYYLRTKMNAEVGFDAEASARSRTEEDRAANPIRFGSATLPRFRSNSGGYIRADDSGTQMLLNFCMLQQSYETVSLRSLLAGEIDPQRLRDRIIIVGRAAIIAKNSFITSAAKTTLHSTQSSTQHPTKIIYGIEVHSLVVQQIIRSALEEDCALRTWPDLVEYIYIVCWGLVGVAISVTLRSPWKSVLALSITTLVLISISYGLLIQNVWTPVVPAVLALVGAGLTTAFFDRDMRFELAQRRATIERTYEAVHNGPLQRLSALSRQINSHQTNSTVSLSREQVEHQLRSLNTEMRNIFETMRQETFSHRDSLYIDDSTFLDLQQPISDLLYQVYEYTLNQPLPGFRQIRAFITPIFENFSEARLTLEDKRGLCLFLQESLLNVGNHAMEATRLDVVCLFERDIYRLQIVDNGVGLDSSGPARQGTRQAIAIARQLNGEFQRRPYQPRGTLCELSWPKRRSKRLR